MKKLFFTAMLFSSLFANSQDFSQAKWKTDVVADGSADEWNRPLRFYSNDAKLFFSIANDSTNLLLCFQVNDDKTQLKISKAGMKIGLKAKGDLKCDASIEFPLAGKKELPRVTDDEPEPSTVMDKRHTMMAQNVSLSAKGFATQNGIVGLKEKNGIQAAINWDEKNTMTYELVIPLKELFGSGFALKDLTKAITLTIEINALTRPESRNRDNTNSGGTNDVSGAGSGGMGGGGMGGGSGGGMGGMGGGAGGGHKRDRDSDGPAEQGDSLFDPHKFKQQFLLAQHAGE